jgi:hypothetical protein
MTNNLVYEVEFSCELIPTLQGLPEGAEDDGFWVFRRDLSSIGMFVM